MKLTKKLVLKLLAIPLISLAVIFLGIYAINKLIVDKYWWYYNFDDGLAILERNPAKVLRLALTCPENNENPFEYEYPINESENIAPTQLITFQAKENYIIYPRQIKIDKNKDYVPAWGYYTDRGGKIIFYRFSELTRSIFDKLLTLSNEELKGYSLVQEYKSQKDTWLINNETKIRFSYSIQTNENQQCQYPYIYTIKTK